MNKSSEIDSTTFSHKNENLNISKEIMLSRKIESCCYQLPSEILYNLATTKDLLTEWARCKEFANLLGKCLKARFGSGDGTPAKEALEKGNIDLLTYELITKSTNLYVSLFQLFQSAWFDIRNHYLEKSNVLTGDAKSLFDSFIPNNEIELFLEYIASNINEDFISCVKGCEVSAKNLNNLSLFLNRKYGDRKDLNIKDLEQLDKIFLKFNPYKNEEFIDLKAFTLEACIKAAERDSVIADDLNILYQRLASTAQIIRLACEKDKESLGNNRVVGIQWRNQECFTITGNNKKMKKYS